MFHSLFRSRSARFFLTILFLSSMNPATAGWQDVLKDIQKDIQHGATEAVEEIGNVVTGTKKPTVKITTSSQENTTERTLSAPSTKRTTSIFESMSMQFLLANRDKIQPEVAAAMYGYAVKDFNRHEQECQQLAKINNSIDARSKLTALHTEMLAHLKNNPDRYANHEYTVTLNSFSNTRFLDYDHKHSALIVGAKKLDYKVSAQGNRPQRKFLPCKAVLDLPKKAQVPEFFSNFLPREFMFRFAYAVRRIQGGKDKDKRRSFIKYGSKEVELVPMSPEKALSLLNRPMKDRELKVDVVFEFKPSQPYYAFDDVKARGERKPIPGTTYLAITREWSHKPILKSISYTDKKTGELIYRLGINNNSFTCESVYQPGGGLVKCPSMIKAKAELPTGDLDNSNKDSQTKRTAVKTPASGVQLSEAAITAGQQCRRKEHVNGYYDCDCMAQTMNQKSPEETRDFWKAFGMILHDPEGICARPSEDVAKAHYLSCVDSPSKKKDPYCSCMGNTIAEQFAELPVASKENRRTFYQNAKKTCRDNRFNN